MKPESKSVLKIAILFIAGGLVSAAGGVLTMISFFKQPSTGEDITVSIIIRGVVVPHIFIFLGVGVFVYGVILIAKIIIITKRKNHLPQSVKS